MHCPDFHIFTSLFGILGLLQFVASGYIAIEPNAKIVQFRATVAVPKSSTSLQVTGIQSFWPALETANSTSILQNVIANEGDILGQWSFFEYFYDPLAGIRSAIHGVNREVYPGDIVASGFILMTGSVQWVGLTKSHQWFVEWRVRRGEVALARGERDFAGSATLDLEGYPNIGDFTQAILATEVSRKAKWEMGPLVWDNIDVQTNTTDTDWCSVDRLLLKGVQIEAIKEVVIYPAITGMTCVFRGLRMVVLNS